MKMRQKNLAAFSLRTAMYRLKFHAAAAMNGMNGARLEGIGLAMIAFAVGIWFISMSEE
ncbi:hypothetical protein FACS189491_03570 [Spirochaetia bacterium]|nr:hypothetical protein FACS189491_03570 [Spirochaetia bacterium]